MEFKQFSSFSQRTSLCIFPRKWYIYFLKQSAFCLVSILEPCKGWFFAFFSGVLDWIVLILVWFKRSLHSVHISGQSCPWTLKLMTSQAVEGTRICTGGSGANGLNTILYIKVSLWIFPLTLSSSQEWSFNRDTLFVPFKAPVTTLAPSICKLTNKLLSDSEHPSQTTLAYSKDERTKDNYMSNALVTPKPPGNNGKFTKVL